MVTAAIFLPSLAPVNLVSRDDGVRAGHDSPFCFAKSRHHSLAPINHNYSSSSFHDARKYLLNASTLSVTTSEESMGSKRR